MELEEFNSCKCCKYVNSCTEPCEKFLQDGRMDYLDREYTNSRTNIEKDIEAVRSTEQLEKIKKDLERVQVNAKIVCVTKEGKRFKGTLVQKTDAFLVLKELYIKTVSIIDILSWKISM